MALQFENATFGYDPEKMIQLISDIRVNCIESATTKITNGLETINTEVDDCWAGTSAKAYKQKFQTDAEKVITAIKQLEECINDAMESTGKGIQKVDESITF